MDFRSSNGGRSPFSATSSSDLGHRRIVSRLNDQLHVQRALQRVHLEKECREFEKREQQRQSLLECQARIVAASSPYGRGRSPTHIRPVTPRSQTPRSFYSGYSPESVNPEVVLKAQQAREARHRALQRAKAVRLQKEADKRLSEVQRAQEIDRRQRILQAQADQRAVMRLGSPPARVDIAVRRVTPEPRTFNVGEDFDDKLQARVKDIVRKMRTERDVRQQDARERAERLRRAREKRPAPSQPIAQTDRVAAAAEAARLAALTRHELEQRKAAAAAVVQRVWRRYRLLLQMRNASKRRRQRRTVARELFDTEQKYVTDLKTVRDLFITPLRDGKVLKDGDIRTVFGNLEELIKLNELILVEMERHMSSAIPDAKIGEIFQKTAPFLKAYMPYCSNYQNALQLLSKLRSNDKFNAIVDSAQANQKCGGLTLVSFLITPVQRIPRYEMLLKELLKVTDVEHPDFDDVTGSLEKIKGIASYVNEGIRTFERMSRVLQIQNQLSGLSGREAQALVQPSRLFVREGSLMEKYNKKSVRQRHFFLFNDALLCASKNSRFAFADYEFKYMLELQQVAITDMTTDELDNGIVLKYKETDTIILGAETPELKLEWVADLKMNMESARRRIISYSPSLRHSVGSQ